MLWRMSLLEVDNLSTWFRTEVGVARAVDGVSFSLDEGGSLALVGESACGKSVTALSIMRLIRPPGYHPTGEIRFAGTELLSASPATLQSLRGNEISMIFQEPMTSLNPVFSVGNQLAEPLLEHQGMTSDQARRRGLELLGQMGIPSPEIILNSYPHQLSGGMRQRIMIAMAIACRPRLMIADEPTTALDVTVQAQILELIKGLQKEIGMALILITHDLGIVSQMSDDICVMYSGQVAEYATRRKLLERARHPYTVKLLESIPRGVSREGQLSVIRGMVRPATDYPPGCRFAERCDFAAARCTASQPPSYALPGGGEGACFLYDPLHPLPRRRKAREPRAAAAAQGKSSAKVVMELRGLRTHFPVKKGFFQRVVGQVKAVDHVTLSIREGTTLGLVGESGCGKTTLGQSLVRLESEARGEVLFEGSDLLTLKGRELRKKRRFVQIIFQDPYSSLNPRLLVEDIVGEGLSIHEPELSEDACRQRIHAVLEEVGLDAGAGERYAHEFSGGQRQRIAIARALILRPRFIVLDEATSALDVSVQAQILNLLRDLQVRHGLTYLFITHDLGVVQYIAHEVAVMYLGRIVEYGETSAVFARPSHPYTRSLLASVPEIGRRRKVPPPLPGEVPSPIDPPQGCHFHPRCQVLNEQGTARLREACPTVYPEAVTLRGSHWARCYAAEPAKPKAAARGGRRAGSGRKGAKKAGGA
ncbi:MAG: dipeptide ABC transporter ATP-binding protein [SAR324 cluster bacterium]|nr:dipeptide ABC transporter ATP-binding protein [SAR324 cluster bacterium]